MNVVIDANVLIAALLGSRSTLAIITSQNYTFYVPEYIVKEIRKYQDHICKITGYSKEEFEVNLSSLMRFVNILDSLDYKQFNEKAKSIIGDVDSKDIDYIACAIAIDASFIWSNDKDFRDQISFKIKTTEEIIEEGK